MAETSIGETSTTNELPFRYSAALADGIERRWQAHWDQEHTFQSLNPSDKGFDASRPKYYCLDMFPYPSGAGLHVGHPVGYIATDVICRYKRARGFNVLHPMGWDAFGLPAEQYAVQTGVHPSVTTRNAINTFRKQLKRFGFSYDWGRELATIDPDYYKWTQWIWLQCYHAYCDPKTGKARPIGELEFALARENREVELPPAVVIAAAGTAGTAPRAHIRKRWLDCTRAERQQYLDTLRLAYRGGQTVNWCPKLGTVLANEEVIDGRSERGGHPVFRMPLLQWMFRITAFADRLLEDLQLVNWPASTRSMQAEWIGRSDGAEVRFAVSALPSLAVVGEAMPDLEVFTTRPDTLFGATYMVVAPEHALVTRALAVPAAGTNSAALAAYVALARNRSDVNRQSESKNKSGVFTGYFARNPATGEAIPVWTADYVLMGYGTGAIMAVPGHDQRDFEFAQLFGLPVKQVVTVAGVPFTGECAVSGEGVACASSSAALTLDGLATANAKERTIAWLESVGNGKRRVQYRLHDWLFSRQRYWGEPFPVVFDEEGLHHPVSERALPVLLPSLADFAPVISDAPVPPLGKVVEWVQTTAGAAGVDASELPPTTKVRRETNTMPNWAGSCWYYLRFCDPHNDARFVDSVAERYWMGNGGVDLYVGGSEHAVLHLLYARFWHKVLYDLGHVSTVEPFATLFHQGLMTSFAYARPDGSLVPADEVVERGGKFFETATDGTLEQIVAKMSKSLKNVINPDDIVAQFGADTLRLYEMYMGPLEASKPWNARDISGVFRFLQRFWRLAVDEQTGNAALAREADPKLERLLHRTIQRVGQDIERLAFNTAIAALIEMVNAATRPTELRDPAGGGLTGDQLHRLTIALAPLAPHIAEEVWARLGNKSSISGSQWPAVDARLLVDDEVEIPVQVLGKLRGRIMVPASDAGDVMKLEAFALAHPAVEKLLGGKPVRKVVAVPGRMVNLII
ncbi:MAG: leucine--tRNA ligase [Phycisphaerales bacterium]|nr:leucine--tRNA ligase [Phycisphaerales bacterium]